MRYLTNSLGTDILARMGRGVQLSSSQSVDLSFPSSSNLVYMKDGVQTVETSVVTVKTLTNGTFKDFYAFDSQLTSNDLQYIKDNAEKMFREVTNLYGKAPFVTPTSNIGNVKDYGAVGDGTTDDREAIQACFDDANVFNVYFPAGTYMMGPQYSGSNSSIKVDNHIKVIYSDADAKLLGKDGVMFPLRNSMSLDGLILNELSFENVGFTLNTQNQTLKNITVQNCYFEVVAVDGVWDQDSAGGLGANGRNADSIVNFKALNNKFVNIVGGAIGLINRDDRGKDADGKWPTDSIHDNLIANNEIYFDASVAPIKAGFNIGISFGEGIENSTIEYNFIEGYEWGIENTKSGYSIIRHNYTNTTVTGLSDTAWSTYGYVGYNYFSSPDTSIGMRDAENWEAEYNICYGQLMLTTSSGQPNPVSATVKHNHVVSNNKDAIVMLHFPNATINNNYVESSAHYGISVIGTDSLNNAIDNSRYFVPNNADFLNNDNVTLVSYTNNVDVAQEIAPTYSGLPLYANLTSLIPMNNSGSSVYDHKQDTSFSISGYDSSVNKTDLSYGTQSIMFDANGDVNGMMNFQDGDDSMYVKDIATYPIKIEETTENDDVYTYYDNGTSATLDTNGTTVSTTQLTNIKLGEISRIGGATSTVVKLYKVFE